MKFVADEDLPRSTSQLLEELGHDVLDIREYKLCGASDLQVFEFAQAKKAILLSGDMGFSNILQFPVGSHFGIIIAHFPNQMSTKEVNRQLHEKLIDLTSEDIKGNLIILQPGKIRIRRNV